MYTVLRVTGSTDKIENIKSIGNRINEIQPYFYTGIRNKGDGFSEDISKSALWTEHVEEIKKNAELFQSVLLDCKENDLEVTFDVCIDREDIKRQKSGLFLHQDNELLKKVSDAGASIEISVYLGNGTFN